MCVWQAYIKYSLNAAFVLYTLIALFLSLQERLQPQRYPSKSTYITHMFLLNATYKGRNVDGVGFMCRGLKGKVQKFWKISTYTFLPKVG